MKTVILSRKFQVVIPKKIREGLELRAGQKLVLLEKGNSIELVKIGNLKEALGLAGGVSAKNLREEHERFD